MNLNKLRVEIVVLDQIDDHWAAWFDDLDLCPLDGGATLLRGCLRDQAALHGALERIRDLNLKLYSVKVEER